MEHEKLDAVNVSSQLSLADFWGSRPGPNDAEILAKYRKPYLTERESKVIFLHMRCGLTFPDIARRMHVKTPTLRQLWKRAVKKTIEAEGKQSDASD